jgi:glycosyltransferase involved in cell wall biosynthesis
MAKIDVVVPCYNYGRFLDACVRSVLEQSIRDLRVLIIDDASTDDSLSVAKKLAKDDPRVSLIAHYRNKGHIGTYNEGIAWASADYFLLLSADDLLVAGALERAIEIMDDNPDVVLTHGECIVWYDDHPPPPVATQRTCTWARHDLISDICATGTNLVATPTAIGRTNVQKDIGGYKESLPHSGDMEMWLRFAAHGAVARIDAVQAIYRRHSSAMSHAYFARMSSDYRQRQQAFDSFFDEYDHRLINSRVLRSGAGRVMANRAFRCGIGLIRRGHLNEGFQLVRAATDDRLRYFSPVWKLAKLPRTTACDGAKSGLEASGQKMRELSEALAGAEPEHHNREH